MDFEWDPHKDAANQRKHGVTFLDAATVFADPLSTTFPDPDHSLSEQRLLIIGMSITGHLLVVAYAEREDRIRIISARMATRSERDFYEKG